MAVLPQVGLAEIPAGPGLDEPVWRARRLWLAALEVTLADAAGRGMGAVAHRYVAQGVARSWLRRPSRDRSLVLEFCGIDPEAFVDFGLPDLEAEWARLDELKLRPPHEHGFSRVTGRTRAAA